MGGVQGLGTGVGGRGEAALVVEDRNSHHAVRRPLGEVGRLHLRRQLALPLVAAVLEPDLDLSLREVEGGGEARALRGRQVALHVEGGLELEHLGGGEGGGG